MTDYCPEGIPDTPLGRYVRLVTPSRRPVESNNTYTKEAKERAMQAHIDGMDLEDVSTMTGIPLRTVRDWCSKAGILRSRRKRYDKEFIAAVVERMRQGEGVRKLERELGLSRGTIQFWRRYL